MNTPRHQPGQPSGASPRFLSGRNRPGRPARRTDSDGYAAAEQIQAQRPHWMIIFGCYSRQFVAWPLFPVSRSIIVHASYPRALIDRLDQAEHAYRIHPAQENPRP